MNSNHPKQLTKRTSLHGERLTSFEKKINADLIKMKPRQQDGFEIISLSYLNYIIIRLKLSISLISSKLFVEI